jgi:hypothetical protein
MKLAKRIVKYNLFTTLRRLSTNRWVIMMKKSEEGFTNPLGSSAYFPPPYPFKNAETVMIEFEAPREAIEAELPEPLEFQPGTAFAVVQDAQIASGAPFHEG